MQEQPVLHTIEKAAFIMTSPFATPQELAEAANNSMNRALLMSVSAFMRKIWAEEEAEAGNDIYEGCFSLPTLAWTDCNGNHRHTDIWKLVAGYLQRHVTDWRW